MYIVKISTEQASQLVLESEIKTVYGLTGILYNNRNNFCKKKSR